MQYHGGEEKMMQPYIIEELSRYRRQEIDKEFEHIHLYRKLKVKPPRKKNRAMNTFLALRRKIIKTYRKWLLTSPLIGVRDR
jgi:hypothetical protein